MAFSARFRSEMSRAILDAPTMAALCVPDRRNGQGNIQQRAVLAPPNGLEMIDALATFADGSRMSGLFLNTVRRNQHRDRLADRFPSRIAEQALGAPVPAGDDAVQILADDGVVRGIDNRAQQQDGSLGAFPRGDVLVKNRYSAVRRRVRLHVKPALPRSVVIFEFDRYAVRRQPATAPDVYVPTPPGNRSQ